MILLIISKLTQYPTNKKLRYWVGVDSILLNYFFNKSIVPHSILKKGAGPNNPAQLIILWMNNETISPGVRIITYSTTISSEKIQAFPPTPRCHSGHIFRFMA